MEYNSIISKLYMAISSFMPERIAFYAGSPTDKQKEMAELLLSFLENVDEVLSAKSRFIQSL